MRLMKKCLPPLCRVATLAICFCGVIVIAADLRAQSNDYVVAVSENGDGQVKRSGEIIDYSGRGVRIRNASGRSTFVPLDEIIEIHTDWSASHRAGDAAATTSKLEEAVEHYEKAIRSGEESRPWVRRWILASIIRCRQALGQHDLACRYFMGLLHDDDETPHFEVIPLAWLPGQRLNGRDAERWITDKMPAARLLGASYLLNSRLREKAIDALEQLREAEDPRVAGLAAAQLWRTKVVTATAADVEAFGKQIEKLDQPLRAGPYYLLGKAQVRLENFEAASLTFMHVPILFPQHQGLASECLLAAGSAMQESGELAEAARLYQELIEHFADTTAAADAEQRLEQMKSAS